MNIWKHRHLHGMGAGQGQLTKAAGEQTAAKRMGIDRERGSLEALLDGNFPNADRAEKNLVRRIAYVISRRRRQPLRVLGCPDQEMSVGKKFQMSSPTPNISSMSSLPISLNSCRSSGTIQFSSAQKPNLETLDAVVSSIGTNFATGLPALAIVKDSPARTFSTSRERWVFASCMFTVSMNLVYQT
jgi:hypothetical protein